MSVTAPGSVNCALISPSAQALYSLSQDNPPFRHALYNHPTALPALVAIAREDHTAAEDSVVRKTKTGKGKEKSSDADGHADELGDGRALLVRVLVCGASRVPHPASCVLRPACSSSHPTTVERMGTLQ
jgi:hypothetical protein